MSWKKFDEKCKGCGPVIINMKTRKPYAEDSPEMIAVMAFWKTTTREERLAFHRFCCLNSRAPLDLQIMERLSEQMGKVIVEAVAS